jgi:hypothetical protein
VIKFKTSPFLQAKLKLWKATYEIVLRTQFRNGHHAGKKDAENQFKVSNKEKDTLLKSKED